MKFLAIRLVIPSEDQNGLNTRLAAHFGRAPYFTVVELDSKGTVLNVKSVLNISEHMGGSGLAPDHILALKPNAVIVSGMGGKAIDIFECAGVPVLQANSGIVNDIVVAYNENKLPKLTEGCGHAH